MEVLVGVAILSIILGTIGAAFFQSVSTQRTIVADGLAINEARKGLSWFAPDVRMAQHAVLDADGVLTLSWTDDFVGPGTPVPLSLRCHTSEYKLVDDTLNRTYDGTTHAVARRVASVIFTAEPANAITIALEVENGPGTTETVSMTTSMMSKPKESLTCPSYSIPAGLVPKTNPLRSSR